MKDDQQFLYTIRPVRIEMLTEGPTARETEVISLHFDHLSELATQGIVEFAGRTDTDDERTFGIVVFNARSEKDALKIVHSDPAVAEGVMVPELFPFRLAVRASY
jgi:uncharacterized protein YciI